AFERWTPPSSPSATPALVLGGTRDRFCLSDHLVEWDRYYSSCRFDWVEASHHFPQEQPVASAAAIASFVRSLSHKDIDHARAPLGPTAHIADPYLEGC